MNNDPSTYPLLNLLIPIQINKTFLNICQVIELILNINLMNYGNNYQCFQMMSVSGIFP